jgi:hypothetical protein
MHVTINTIRFSLVDKCDRLSLVSQLEVIDLESSHSIVDEQEQIEKHLKVSILADFFISFVLTYIA